MDLRTLIIGADITEKSTLSGSDMLLLNSMFILNELNVLPETRDTLLL